MFHSHGSPSVNSKTQRKQCGTLCEAQTKSMRGVRATSEAPERIMKDEGSDRLGETAQNHYLLKRVVKKQNEKSVTS